VAVVQIAFLLRRYWNAPKPMATAPAGEIRVLVIGDSISMSMSGLNQGYPDQMEHELASTPDGPHYRFINTSYPSQRTRSALKRLPDQLEKWHPQVAILMLGKSDVLPINQLFARTGIDGLWVYRLFEYVTHELERKWAIRW